jgi:hypothetical protein
MDLTVLDEDNHWLAVAKRARLLSRGVVGISHKWEKNTGFPGGCR